MAKGRKRVRPEELLVVAGILGALYFILKPRGTVSFSSLSSPPGVSPTLQAQVDAASNLARSGLAF